MRLRLCLSESTGSCPFDHLHILTGVLHRWLGRSNPEHEGPSLYAFGWLKSGVATKQGLTFPSGSQWDLAFWDIGAAKRVIHGIRNDPTAAFGMRVREILEVAEPAFSDSQRFRMASPFIARTRDGSQRKYLSWKDPDVDGALTRALHTKLHAAGLDDHVADSRIEVQRNDPRARSKLVRIRDIAHKASFCHINVHGGPDCSRFVWLTGVGALTGCGMGMIE